MWFWIQYTFHASSGWLWCSKSEYLFLAINTAAIYGPIPCVPDVIVLLISPPKLSMGVRQTPQNVLFGRFTVIYLTVFATDYTVSRKWQNFLRLPANLAWRNLRTVNFIRDVKVYTYGSENMSLCLCFAYKMLRCGFKLFCIILDCGFV